MKQGDQMVSSEVSAEMIPLEQSLENLINGYREADDLLQNQINAVIQNDFDTLNELISKQIDHYNLLSDLESKFRTNLQNTAKEVGKDEDDLKLSGLLRYLPSNSNRLSDLREKLIQKVDHVRDLSQQLINLIRYAREFNVSTIRNIAVTAGQQAIHYNDKGKRSEDRISTFSIDEKG